MSMKKRYRYVGRYLSYLFSLIFILSSTNSFGESKSISNPWLLLLLDSSCNIRSFTVTPSQVDMTVDDDGRILDALVIDADGDILDASNVTWLSKDPDTAYVTQETGSWT